MLIVTLVTFMIDDDKEIMQIGRVMKITEQREWLIVSGNQPLWKTKTTTMQKMPQVVCLKMMLMLKIESKWAEDACIVGAKWTRFDSQVTDRTGICSAPPSFCRPRAWLSRQKPELDLCQGISGRPMEWVEAPQHYADCALMCYDVLCIKGARLCKCHWMQNKQAHQ